MSDFEVLKYYQQRQMERRNQNKISTREDRNTETHAENRKKERWISTKRNGSKMDEVTNAKDMAEARKALLQSFPGSFINSRDEFIAHMKANECILLSNCETPEDIECKVLEWFSRAAFKSQPYSQEWRNRKFHEFMLRGINAFLETNFSPEDMEIIYQKLGNRIRHELTVGFVEHGKDIEWLENQ